MSIHDDYLGTIDVTAYEVVELGHDPHSTPHLRAILSSRLGHLATHEEMQVLHDSILRRLGARP